MGNKIPARETIDSPHIIVSGNSYTIVQTGEKVTATEGGTLFNGDALANALRFHGFPGVVVLVYGNQHMGMKLNGTNPNLKNTVAWEGQNVRDINIMGGEPDKAAQIGDVGVYDKTGNVRIQNATIMNHRGSFAPLLVMKQGVVGNMRLYDIDFMPMDPGAWQGNGMKWNIRGHGAAQWDCRNIKFHKALEHGGYIDNHQGDSYFTRCYGESMGRTLLQFTNRKESGPSAYGDLVIKRCVARYNKGNGGSDFTIVGNGDGTVWFANNTSIGHADGSHGAFTHWTDFGHGAYLTSGGHSTRRLIIVNFTVNHPNADRDHVSITGCDNALMSKWDITGNKTALELNGNFGGGNHMNEGAFRLHTRKIAPSQSPGWKSWKKVRDQITGKWLSDTEIDELKYIRGGN